jgi:hypothetical protein
MIGPVTETLHVTLAGALTGRYVVEEQLAGGGIVLAPEPGYPSVFPAPPGRPATAEEFQEHFGDLLPGDEP